MSESDTEAEQLSILHLQQTLHGERQKIPVQPVSKKGERIVRLEHAGKKKSYLTAAVGAVIGYLIFFSSSFWYPTQKAASDYTPIGQLQEIGKTGSSVTVIYWAYAQKQNAMSVELDMSAVKGDVSFAAVDKERRDIPVTVEFSQSGTYILKLDSVLDSRIRQIDVSNSPAFNFESLLKLDSVQQDFQAVSLRVTVQDKTIRLYTNEGQVDHVDELTFYSDLDGYYQARIKRNILELEQEIQQVKDSIQQWDEEISSYKEQIAQTKARLPYLSQKQRTDAQNSITAWEKQIEDCQGQQKEANEQISQLTDEINAQKNMISEEGVSELDKKCNEEEMKQNVSESDTQKEWEEHR